VDNPGNEIPLPTIQQEHRTDDGLQSSFHLPVEQASGQSFIASQFRGPLFPNKTAVSARKRKAQHNVSDSDNAGSDSQPSSDDDTVLSMRPQKHVMKKSKAQTLPSASKAAVGRIEKHQLPSSNITSLPSTGEVNHPSADSWSQPSRMSNYVLPSEKAIPGRKKQLMRTTNTVGDLKPDVGTRNRTGRSAKLKTAGRLGEYFQTVAESYNEKSDHQAEEFK
jgi:hypothetical protein